MAGRRADLATKRPGKSQRTRATLAAATRAEIAATATFTAERVAARAGTSPATFYTHFPTKDEALTAAFELVLAELVERSNAALDAEALRTEGLQPRCERLVSVLVSIFSGDALVFRVALARMAEVRPLRDLYRRSEAASLHHLERFIADGQALGLIRVGPPAELAELVLVLSQGVNNPRLLRTRATAATRALRAGWVEALVGLLSPGG